MDSEEQRIDFEALAASKGMKAEEYHKILLVEYEEIGRCWRHDNETAWRILSIFVPTSLAGLFLSAKNSALIFAIGLLAVILIWLTFFLYLRQHFYMSVRFYRARDIENLVGMKHQLDFKERCEQQGRKWPLIFWNRQIVRMLALAVTAVWVGLFIYSILR